MQGSSNADFRLTAPQEYVSVGCHQFWRRPIRVSILFLPGGQQVYSYEWAEPTHLHRSYRAQPRLRAVLLPPGHLPPWTLANFWAGASLRQVHLIRWVAFLALKSTCATTIFPTRCSSLQRTNAGWVCSASCRKLRWALSGLPSAAIQLTLSFEIKNIETCSIGVVLVGVIHKSHQNFLEPHKIYLGLVLLVGEFEIEYFCIAFTRMSKKWLEILDYTFFCQDVTRELSLFSLIFKFTSQLFESSL